MLDTLTFSGRELLLAVVLASAVYLLEVLLFSRRRNRARQDRLAARVEELERGIAALGLRLEALEARPPNDSTLDALRNLHAEAARMARAGATAAELAEQLGISLTEAELIIALQKSGS
ncbi:MAG: DUF2802 domain-containing protein [Verrucomicrobia bacterium]|jgi:hypothetical protein|nr:DUF2802 domain-containing protein [Verrucomicrobiota bacterium]